MTPLWMKLGRDLKANWGQFLAVVVVIALGSGFFIASFSSYQGVQNSLQRTYQELAMPNYWLSLDGEGPPTLLPGMELRETAQVALELSQGEKTGAQVIGLPLGGPQYAKLKLTSGSLPGEGQVLVEASFAKFHDLKLGDAIAVRNGDKVYNWVVSGIAGSPEYIWPVVNRFVPVPSPRSYGVLYVPEKQLIRDLTGLQHEILLDSNANVTGVMTYLQSQGVKISSVYARNEQPSNQVLQLMIGGFGKVAAILPWLFLLAAALATYALISVLVKAQSSQITVLRYLGFSQGQILLHYLSFALLAGLVGSGLGSVLGTALSYRLTGSLAGIIGLPFVVAGVQQHILFTAIICCSFAALLGGLVPALYTTKYRELKEITVPSWHRFIPVTLRLPVNNLRRDFHNTVFSVGVIALGIGIVAVGLLLYQSVAASAQKQYNQYQAYDLKVQFRTPLKEDVTEEIAKIPGVENVNPCYELPVLVQMGQKQVPSMLVGAKGDMLRLENRLGQPVQLNGLLLSEGVRDGLKAKWTPRVSLITLTGKKSEATVKGYVRWSVGNQIFAPLDLVQTLSGRKGISGAYLRVAEAELAQVKAALYKYPTVMLVDSPQENYADQETLTKFTYVYLRILIVFGLLLAAAMIFATARVNILARSREYITMRVLGIGLGKISLTVIIEYLCLLLTGVLLGALAGTILAGYLLKRVNSPLFYNVLTVKSESIILIAILSILIIPAAVLSSTRAIKNLNLTENTREHN